MEPEGSLLHWEALATCPDPEPDQSSLCLPILLLKYLFQYYPTIYASVFQVVSFPQVSPLKPCMHLPSLTCMPHAPPISFFLIWSPQ